MTVELRCFTTPNRTGRGTEVCGWTVVPKGEEGPRIAPAGRVRLVFGDVAWNVAAIEHPPEGAQFVDGQAGGSEDEKTKGCQVVYPYLEPQVPQENW